MGWGISRGVPDDPTARPTGARIPRRLLSGTAWLVAGRLVRSASTLTVLWVLARTLSTSELGRFAFWLAAFAILESFADLGTGGALIQRTAAAPQRVALELSAARRVRGTAALAGAFAVAAGALALGETGAGWLVLAGLYPLTHVLELSAVVYKNRLAWGVPVAVRAGASLLALSLVLSLVALGVRGAAPLVAAQVGGHASANFALYLLARRHVPARPAGPVPWRALLRTALPLGLAGVCQQAYFYVDHLFVRALAGEAELGRYGICVRLMSFSILLAVYTALASLPWLVRRREEGALGPALCALAQPLLALACAAAGLVLPHSSLVLSLFGPEYPPAAPALARLLVAAAIVHAGAILSTGLIAAGRTRALLAVAAGGLAVNLLANSLLVPPRGALGAAEATLLTEIVVALGAGVALTRAGAELLPRGRRLAWLAGPALLALCAALSSALPLPS